MEETRQANAGIRILTVTLGEDRYGLPIDQMEGIVPWAPLTRVPGMPRFAAGMVQIRGTIVPVIDMRTRVGLPRPTDDTRSRIVIMIADGSRVGLLVDTVDEVVWVANESIQAQVPMVVDSERPMVSGVARLADGLAVLLDDRHLFSAPELAKLRKLEQIPANP